jgi:hypothetical protein
MTIDRVLLVDRHYTISGNDKCVREYSLVERFKGLNMST